jgi:hypothetical protein
MHLSHDLAGSDPVPEIDRDRNDFAFDDRADLPRPILI